MELRVLVGIFSRIRMLYQQLTIPAALAATHQIPDRPHTDNDAGQLSISWLQVLSFTGRASFFPAYHQL